MNKLKFFRPISMMVLLGFLAACASTRQVTSGDTNQCLNVERHGYTTPGTPLRMKPCDPWQNQQWSFHKDGQVTGVDGMCVDVQGNQATEGAAVIYVPCNGSPSQRWTVNGAQLIGIGGKCLDITGGGPATGAPLIVAACNGAPSQQWQLH